MMQLKKKKKKKRKKKTKRKGTGRETPFVSTLPQEMCALGSRPQHKGAMLHSCPLTEQALAEQPRCAGRWGNSSGHAGLAPALTVLTPLVEGCLPQTKTQRNAQQIVQHLKQSRRRR